ncbi:MAG TPA: hypothetical protein PL110_12715 [Candidatus Eremiobacteraeota bacterium]|nr:hypothetical protein [Candidatus Eremiobacteraeota bacterium]
MSISSVSNQPGYTSVKIEKWQSKSKGNTSVWNSLKNAGYTNKEIVEQKLVEKVAKENNLKDPNVVQAGQELLIPTKVKEAPKADPVNSQDFVKTQSKLSKSITGGDGSTEHISGGYEKEDKHKVEAITSGSVKKGEVELEGKAGGEASTHSESKVSSKFRSDEHGMKYKGEVSTHSEAGAKAGAEDKLTLGEDGELSTSRKAEGKAKIGAEGKADLEVSHKGLKGSAKGKAHAQAEAGLEREDKIKIGEDVELSAREKAEIKADAGAEGKTELEISNERLKASSEGKVHAGVEAGLEREDKIKIGEDVELSAREKAEIKADAGAEGKTELEISNERLKASSEGKVYAGVEAGVEIEDKIKVGEDTELSAKMKAEAKLKAEAEGKSELELSDRGVRASAGARAKAEASVREEVGGKLKVGDKEVSGKGYAYGSAIAEGEVKSELELSKDRVALESKVKGEAWAKAAVGAEGEVKTKEGSIKGSVETGVRAGGEVETSGRFKVSKDELNVGFRVAEVATAGEVYTQINTEAKTKAGSGTKAEVTLVGGESEGITAGGGLNVNKEGIHAEVELGGRLLVGAELKVGVDFKYEDMKKPEFLLGTAIGGPVGGVAAVMARPVIEKAGEVIADGASAVADGAKSLWNKLWD